MDFDDDEEEKEENSLTVTNGNNLLVPNNEIDQMNEVVTVVMENITSDRGTADELYSFMKDQIDIEGDHNPATREAMSKAVEHKMHGTDQLIEILKIKAKLINPNKGNNININLGEFDNKKGSDTNGMINIVENLKSELRK
jgi:hypothetical protein